MLTKEEYDANKQLKTQESVSFPWMTFEDFEDCGYKFIEGEEFDIDKYIETYVEYIKEELKDYYNRVVGDSLEKPTLIRQDDQTGDYRHLAWGLKTTKQVYETEQEVEKRLEPIKRKEKIDAKLAELKKLYPNLSEEDFNIIINLQLGRM